MSRQDKATTDRNARTLRDLVKQPDNKTCADCRKNDARWASWNLGVFLCIRCSGIHRSMGTHISKVKSIDLDMWTPEQMENIQKWGNRRANLYWERHLKAGHVPPDHKIESFIRSKYESRRWAMDGPPPSDPSTLENAQSSRSAQPPTIDNASKPSPTSTTSAPPPKAASGPKTHPLLSRNMAPKPTPAAAPVVDLIGGDDPTPSAPTAAPVQTAATSPVNGTATSPATAASTGAGSNIFDLDFRAPTPNTGKPQTNKADIMSLFSSSTSPSTQPQQSFFNNVPNPPQAQNPYASWNGGGTSISTTQQHPSTAPISAPTGGSWGGLQMDQGAWGSSNQTSQPQAQAPAPTQSYNMWNQPPQPTQNAMSAGGGGDLWGASADPWASNGSSSGMGGTGGFTGQAQSAKQPENDPFANIWK